MSVKPSSTRHCISCISMCAALFVPDRRSSSIEGSSGSSGCGGGGGKHGSSNSSSTPTTRGARVGHKGITLSALTHQGVLPLILLLAWAAVAAAAADAATAGSKPGPRFAIYNQAGLLAHIPAILMPYCTTMRRRVLTALVTTPRMLHICSPPCTSATHSAHASSTVCGRTFQKLGGKLPWQGSKWHAVISARMFSSQHPCKHACNCCM